MAKDPVAPAKQLDLEVDTAQPAKGDLIIDTTNDLISVEPNVGQAMINYDARRLHGWPNQSSSHYAVVGDTIYIATVEGHTGAPLLDVMPVDELLAKHG